MRFQIVQHQSNRPSSIVISAAVSAVPPSGTTPPDCKLVPFGTGGTDGGLAGEGRQA